MHLARKLGVPVKVHWPHTLVPKTAAGAFPNASWIAENLILLPLYRALSAASVQRIANAIIEIATE